MISQLTVFLQNEKGHLASACKELSDANINMQALFLADTSEFGVARIFCDTPQLAAKTLESAGYRASITPLVAIRVAHEPGALAQLLQFCDTNNMNVEYAYCFSLSDSAINVLKIDGDDVEEVLSNAGFDVVRPEEIYALD